MMLTSEQREKKRAYIEDYLLAAFILDDRSGVSDMKYKVIESPDIFEERVEVFFQGGGVKRVNVTCDSCSGMYKDIGRAVYG